jgi:predicted TIM-barrel fold metal-dependent hydrolase
VFDRYPELQIILGHWGEMIPFYLDRLDEALPQRATNLDRTIGDYVRQNVYITPSGMFSQAQLRYCVGVLGTNRIVYSVDNRSSPTTAQQPSSTWPTSPRRRRTTSHTATRRSCFGCDRSVGGHRSDGSHDPPG